ncbi:metalloreductase STEAP4-like [Penaeus japonicus]|uniref:metalloreductase STEAP4-like n=1 Tax=Penaeus japonicus TaxID=27405 RepID=UPI001C713746|nr:metalloreductase STEAP4-like [Penaeus japonicus]
MATNPTGISIMENIIPPDSLPSPSDAPASPQLPSVPPNTPSPSSSGPPSTPYPTLGQPRFPSSALKHDVTMPDLPEKGEGESEGGQRQSQVSLSASAKSAPLLQKNSRKRGPSESGSGRIDPGTAFPPYDPRFSLSLPSSQALSAAPCQLPLDDNGRKKIVVLGSGDFGLALTTRLVQANYRVAVGSRDPDRSRSKVEAAGGSPLTHAEALRESVVVVLAVPFQHTGSLPLGSLANKIIVDVSNRNPKDRDSSGRSQAEHLQNLIPTARVVKAFNVLSAYTLSRGIRGSKEVPVCSDDSEAKQLVSEIVKDLRLDPTDLGGLHSAREVEEIPFQFFTEWKFGVILSTIIWCLMFIITLFRSQLCSNLENMQKPNFTWDWSGFDGIVRDNVSSSCAGTSITLLALCYLPGVIAAYIQLVRGTKYSAFPLWMDTWLKGRKHIGILMLWNAAIHAILNLSYSMGSVGFYDDTYSWRGPTYVACGGFTLLLAGVLGVASLPSVAASMTWREFSFVQSRVGWLILLLASCHVIFNFWDGLIKNHFACYFLPSMAQLCIMLPLLTLVLKLPLLMPCVDRSLTRIRQGYERVSVNSLTGV